MQQFERFEWDEAKAASNHAKHGVAFDAIHEFDFDHAIFALDNRRDYAERRFVALGFIGERIHVLVYTRKTGALIRVISLRKANKREIWSYVQKTHGLG
jgi:uncharacterized DUF497 family protein